jgi:hypothetical protein
MLILVLLGLHHPKTWREIFHLLQDVDQLAVVYTASHAMHLLYLPDSFYNQVINDLIVLMDFLSFLP